MQAVPVSAPALAVAPGAVPFGLAAANSAYQGYQIIRRNGAVVAFEPNKVAVALMKAFLAVHGTQGAASASVRETVEGLTEAVVRALRRSRHNRVVAGVCGGLAEFLGISAFWPRLFFLIALIPGGVPGLLDRPAGCLFSPRCSYATEHSRDVRPALRDWQDGQVSCHHPLGDPNREATIQLHRPLAGVTA